jgi:hypothetical protein
MAGVTNLGSFTGRRLSSLIPPGGNCPVCGSRAERSGTTFTCIDPVYHAAVLNKLEPKKEITSPPSSVSAAQSN